MRTKLFTALIGLALLIGCSDENTTIPDTKACFDYSPQENLKVGDEIIFTNCSENATSYAWDFGDGDISTEKEPVHTFQTPDEYNVKLVASNESSVDTISKIISIGGKNNFLEFKGNNYDLTQMLYDELGMAYDNVYITDVAFASKDIIIDNWEGYFDGNNPCPIDNVLIVIEFHTTGSFDLKPMTYSYGVEGDEDYIAGFYICYELDGNKKYFSEDDFEIIEISVDYENDKLAFQINATFNDGNLLSGHYKQN